MEKQFVEYNGRWVIAEWPEKIMAAQIEKTYWISGVEYSRIPYGEESENWGANSHPCRNCAVIKGQLHVPGCDVERCPVCGEQAITCDCEHTMPLSS